MNSKLKNAVRRAVVLLTVGMIAASVGGIANANAGTTDAGDDETASQLGFWDGPK
jgi:hypothetical protein